MNETDLMKLCNYLECNDASMEAQCEAAAELRRLRALCQEMLAALKTAREEAVNWYDDCRGFDPADPPEWLLPIDAAITKAEDHA